MPLAAGGSVQLTFMADNNCSKCKMLSVNKSPSKSATQFTNMSKLITVGGIPDATKRTPSFLFLLQNTVMSRCQEGKRKVIQNETKKTNRVL